MHEHGLYRSPSRLSLGAICTNEDGGFTMWHMLAAGMLPESMMLDFLETTLDEPSDLLIDDLREAMAVFPDHQRHGWEATADYRVRLNGSVAWSWKRFRAESAWKTPLEICHLVRRPLVPADVDYRRMHEVVAAANESSIRDLGIDSR